MEKKLSISAMFLAVIALIISTILGTQLLFTQKTPQTSVTYIETNSDTTSKVEISASSTSKKETSLTKTIKSANIIQQPIDDKINIQNIIAYTNIDRSQNNVGQLSYNDDLVAAAQQKANDMLMRQYFSHTDPDGNFVWPLVEQNGYDYQYVGENLAIYFTGVMALNSAWMASPEHRANILKPEYTNMGVGIAQGMYKGQNTIFVVVLFGSKLK